MSIRFATGTGRVRLDQIAAGTIPAGDLKVGEILTYPFEAYPGFIWVIDDQDPQTCLETLRLLTPSTSLFGVYRPVVDSPLDGWKEWISGLGVVIANDPIARYVLAVYKHDQHYGIIVRRYP